MRKLVYLSLIVMLVNLAITGYANPSTHYDDNPNEGFPPPAEIVSIDTSYGTVVVTYALTPEPIFEYYLRLSQFPDGFDPTELMRIDAVVDGDTLIWYLPPHVLSWPAVFFQVETWEMGMTLDLFPGPDPDIFVGPDIDILPEFESPEFVVLPFAICLLAILVQHRRKCMNN